MTERAEQSEESWRIAREKWEAKTHAVTTRLDHELYAEVEAYATAKKLSICETVRLFIEWGIDEIKSPRGD